MARGLVAICLAATMAFSYWPPALSESEIIRQYASPTLKITIERTAERGCNIYIARIWVAEPSQQIHKAAATWRKNLAFPGELAGEEAVLLINGSGFLSPTYPSYDPEYGKPEDNYFTSLGSIVMTGGVVLRQLDARDFTGLCLEEEGLMLRQGVPTREVAARAGETWAFLENSVLIKDRKPALREPRTPHERSVHRQFAARTVIACTDPHTFIVVSIRKNKEGYGFSLEQTALFMQRFEPEWAFNLDGGGSSAMIFRGQTLAGNQRQVFDCLYFAEE